MIIRPKRGDIALLAAPGDYGKLRPALVVQSDFFTPTHASIAVCLISSDLQDAPLFRITLTPTPENGLNRQSQVMLDKIIAVKCERISKIVGHVDDTTLLQINRLLAVFLGLADARQQ